MPDSTTLKIGDTIRLLCVPAEDVKQRKREIAKDIENPGWTATIIELFIAQQPIVEIDTIDEFGQPWFTVSISINGQLEEHILAMMDEDSWELVNDRKY